MQTLAKCSTMPRYWALPYRDATGRWYIFDRDHADLHIGTLDKLYRLLWCRHDYFADMPVWAAAVQDANQ